MTQSLTTSQILAGATEVMSASGYQQVDGVSTDLLTRVFEDAYGIVALSIARDYGHLRRSWPDAQGELVELLTRTLDRSEPKSWEGYLVLITPDDVPVSELRSLADIRNDTSRVRKLVVTGRDLPGISALGTALLPVLPVRVEEQPASSAELLDALPGLLAESADVPEEVTAAVVNAFATNESLMSAIHREVQQQ